MLRKLISLALCMILCVSASVISACAEETAPVEKRITKIQKAVEEGGDKALWELVNTHYSTNTYVEEGCADVCIWSPTGPAFPEKLTDDDPLINRVTIAFQETAGVGITLENIFSYTVFPDGTCEASESMLSAPLRLDPCSFFTTWVSSPANGDCRYFVVGAAGTDDNGHELEFYGVIQRMNTVRETATTVTIPENPDYDLENIRYEAQFEVPVGENVWWVPVRTLGGSRYTNREIADMLEHEPEQKQEEISTLYEALQLFKVGGFTYKDDDNVMITEGDISWAHYKTARDVVRLNTGNCAGSSIWLHYILHGDYERIGFLAYSKVHELGHIFNYIYQDGYYYFVDLTGYEQDETTAPETANTNNYWFSGAVTGNIHKAKSPEDFVRYYTGIVPSAPNRFFCYEADELLPSVDVQYEDEDRMETYYPEEANVQVIDGKDPEKAAVIFAPGPKKTYNWGNWKAEKIKADPKYLRGGEETEPLTAYQPGDRLTLADESASGRAVVDGTKYVTLRRDEVNLGFEENLYLEGGGNRGVFEYTLPLVLHGEAIRDMNTLVIGELNLGILQTVPETQILICLREGDELVVQEVLDGQYYDSRKISIRRDESGAWQETPDTWYLIITKSKKMKYEFGRFKCAISAEGR